MSRQFAHALFAVAATFAAAPLAAAAPWDIDSAHSAAQFSVRHMMVSTVRGDFGKVTGVIDWDGKTGSVDASIDASTINTREEKRDGHLKSPDFFDVAKFPTITFKSTKIAAAGKGALKVTGNLTMHGVTKEVVLAVDGPTSEIKDPYGNTKIGATATTKINRKDFGLVWNKTLDGGGLAVGDEVTVTIDLELNKKK